LPKLIFYKIKYLHELKEVFILAAALPTKAAFYWQEAEKEKLTTYYAVEMITFRDFLTGKCIF